MKFSYYDKQTQQYILLKVEIEPSLNEVLDETLDTISLVLIPSKKSDPYLPMTTVKVEIEDSESSVLYFCIAVDNIEIFSQKPIYYKHTLSLIQNTRKLSKQLVRNTQIDQPSSVYKESLVALSAGLNKNGGLTRSYYSGLTSTYEKLPIDNREKAKNAWVEIDMQVAVSPTGQYNKAIWGSDIFSPSWFNSNIDTGTFTWNGNLVLYYTLNGVSMQENISINDLGGTLWFNTPMACPKIVNIINQGATNIYLGTTKTTAMWQSTTFNVFDIPFSMTGMNVSQGKTVAFIMIQIRIIAETYYYTAYDVLKLIHDRQLKMNDVSYREPLFELPTREQNQELYDLLTTTVAPNFCWTQNTLYECIADVFRLFDAIFTMDENNILNIEYFNDQNREKVNPRLVGENVSLSEDRYFNGMVSFYQDARTIETFPSKNGYAHLRSDSLGVLSDRSDHFFVVAHPIHSIVDAKIGGIKMLVYNGYTASTDSIDNQRVTEVEVTGNPPLDISHYIVEKSIWMTLDSVETVYGIDPRSLKQNNTIFFEKMDNKIQMAYTYTNAANVTFFSLPGLLDCCGARLAGVYRLFSGGSRNVGWAPQYYGPTIPTWEDIIMNLKYIASTDGVLKVESLYNKLDGESIIDQSNGAVDLNKLGLNILGLTLKMGEPTLAANRVISSISKRIKKGSIYKRDGEIWIANSISYKVLKQGLIQENISFVKNFNLLALRTKILREKRLSNISRELTIKSEDVLSEYVYLSSESKTIEQQTTCFDRTYVFNALTDTFYNKNYHDKLAYAFVDALDTSFEYSGYMSAGTITEVGQYYESIITITNESLYKMQYEVEVLDGNQYDYPFTVTTTQNTLSVICEAQDDRDFDYIHYRIVLKTNRPYIYIPMIKYGAGNALCFEMAFNDSISAGNKTTSKDSSSWLGDYPYFSESVIYTNEYGFRDTMDIKIIARNPEYTFDVNFPSIREYSGQTFLDLSSYEVYKQPNEVFALNYEIILLAVDYNTEFIGSKLIDENFLITDETPIKQELRLYYTVENDNDDFYYSILDKKGHGNYKLITNVSFLSDAILFDFDSITDLKTWAICDKDGNIYFSSNRPFTGSLTRLRLYLYARNKRFD